MNERDTTKICHLNISHKADERTIEELKVWGDFYLKLERVAQKVLRKSIVDSVLLPDDRSLVIAVTWHDVYLSIYDPATRKFDQNCLFENIEYLPTFGKRVKERIEGIDTGIIVPHIEKLEIAMGKQIVKINELEKGTKSTVLEKIQQMKIQHNVDKLDRSYRLQQALSVQPKKHTISNVSL